MALSWSSYANALTGKVCWLPFAILFCFTQESFHQEDFHWEWAFTKSKKSGNLACLQPKQLCGSEEQTHPESIIFQPTLVSGQKHMLSKNLFPPLISVLLLNISPLENTSHFFSKVAFELGSDISFLLTSSCLFAAN